jgi:hypothetical protein
MRFVISTELRIYSETFMAEFTLSDRDNLRFPILLGRKILRKKFFIDVTKKNLSFREKKKSTKATSRKTDKNF